MSEDPEVDKKVAEFYAGEGLGETPEKPAVVSPLQKADQQTEKRVVDNTLREWDTEMQRKAREREMQKTGEAPDPDKYSDKDLQRMYGGGADRKPPVDMTPADKLRQQIGPVKTSK